jgi:hypothetical protein
MQSIVASAIDHIGLTKLGNRFEIRPSAVQKWRDNCRLPQTDLSGLTAYAAGIAELSGGKFTAEQLLAETRTAWEKISPRRGRRKRNGRPS